MKGNEEKGNNNESKKTTKKKTIKFIILLILIIAIGVVYYFLGNKNLVSLSLPEGMYLPKGAKVINNNLEEGVTIQDQNGNQWVWIEVPKDEKNVYKTAGLKITKFTTEEYKKIRNDLNKYVANVQKGNNLYVGDDRWIHLEESGFYTMIDPLISETYGKDADFLKEKNGSGLTYWEYDEYYRKMLKSIYQNGGFYIGRYETGLKDGISTKQGEGGNNETPIIKQDAVVYNNVTLPKAVELSKKLSLEDMNTIVCFNIQWDLALKHFSVKKNGVDVKKINEDSSSWGNYQDAKDHTITSKNAMVAKYISDINGYKWSAIDKDAKVEENTLLSSGASEEFKVMNVYDMAGNVQEFTLGYSSLELAPCSERGGSFSNDGKISPAALYDGVSVPAKAGFRCSLFK